MSDELFVTLIWVSLALVVAAIFPPTRAILKFVLTQAWKIIEWGGKVIWNGGQAALIRVWRAHITVVVNLLPRAAALPSIGKKGTRRD